MTRIGIPAPGITPTSLTQGAPVSALLSQLPSTHAELAVGTFLTGTVLERNANGLTLLQTPNGLLGLKTTVPLPPGSSVTLQIQTAGAQLQAIVLSVTPQAQVGAPVAHPSAHHPVTATSSTPAPTAASAAAPHPSTITATVIGPSGGAVPAATPTAPAAAAQAAATPLPPSTQATPTSPAPAPVAAATPLPPSIQAASTSGPQAAPGAPASQPGATSAPATPQTVLASTQQPTVTDPAAAQAAYQRQLNAVPATPPTATPHAPTQQAVPATPTSGAQPTSPAADGNVAKSVAAEAAPLPTGTQVQVRLLPSLQAGQPALPLPAPDAHTETSAATVRQAAANPAHPNPVIAATVVARTPAGQVILDSAVGRLLAPLPRDNETTAPGTRLLLELIMGERPAASRPTASGLAGLARNWLTLKEAMRQIHDASGQQDTAAAFDRAVPKPGPRLAQQMLSYLESAQNGVRAWLGEPVARVLGQFGGQRMLEQLDRDLREMQLARHGAEGEWRMTLVPLLDGGQLRQIRFFERRRKEEEKRKKEEPARFVVECETSEHGAIQLDGLMHEKRIDLIVRTNAPLPADMEHDILVLFGETCTGLDLAGQVFFQAVPAFPITPLDEIASAPVRVEV